MHFWLYLLFFSSTNTFIIYFHLFKFNFCIFYYIQRFLVLCSFQRKDMPTALSPLGGLTCPHKKKKRLGILENKEISRKSQIWVETQLSAQSPFQKLNFGNSSQKTHKSRYQTFLVLSSFIGLLYFVPNILSRIVVQGLAPLIQCVICEKEDWEGFFFSFIFSNNLI